MKIRLMKEDALAYFKANISENLENYLDKNNSWIYKKIENPFIEYHTEISNFTPIIDESVSIMDSENTKILHNALKNLPRTLATDERLWVGMAHDFLWNYMQTRLQLNLENITPKKIKNNFFYFDNKSSKRKLVIHPLARMWWLGTILYDDKNKDPYHLIDFFSVDFPTKVLTFLSSNYTNNASICRAVISAFVQLEDLEIKINRDLFQSSLRHLNYVAGIRIIDYLDESEITNIIKVHVLKKLEKNKS